MKISDFRVNWNILSKALDYKCRVDDNGDIVVKDEFKGKYTIPTQEQIEAKIKELELEEKYKELLSQNNQEFNDRVNQLTVSYPEREVLTWDKQEQEAREFLKDNTVATPLLDSLSQSRGIDKNVLAQKIVEKADAYAKEVGSLLGKRQKIENLINSKTTIEELETLDIKGLWNE